jgi:hypothetical protein
MYSIFIKHHSIGNTRRNKKIRVYMSLWCYSKITWKIIIIGIFEQILIEKQ